MRPEVRYARNGDINIAYYVFGSGSIDIVSIPAFVSHGELQWEDPRWQDAAERFTPFCRLLWIDKRGTGLSDRGVGAFTVEDVVADVLAVMDDAGVDKAVLWGQSEGGPAALLTAATHPHRVTALVFYGSYAKVAHADDYPIGFDPEALRAARDYVSERWGTGVGLGSWAPSQRHDPVVRDAWARYQRMAASPRDVRAVMEQYATLDVRHVLPAITVPTLVIHRTGDRMVPLEMGKYLADNIDGARFVELEGTDHLLFTEPGDTDVIEEIEEFVTGNRSAAPATRRLATVLFTDIVRSTERAAEVGDEAWLALLDRHDSAVRRALARFGGQEVKTTGDGFLAIFDGPTAAIRCGSAMRGSADAVGLDVRVGVHSGEIEIRGEDIGGIGVHIARRVVDAAAPGEIMVSGTVPGLVVGSGLEFDDRGERTLKGVPGSWRVFALAG